MENRRGNRAETADRILDAADALFCERGYDAVSARDVALRAGVNKALVFYHFGNKGDLFAEVLGRYYRSHQEALAGAFAGEGPLRKRLHRMIEAYFDFMAANRRYARLVQQHIDDPEARRLIGGNLASLADWTERALAGALPEEGPLAARHFFVTFAGAVVNYFTYGPLLAPLWGGDPLAPAALEERRRHVLWMVDALLDGVRRLPRPKRRGRRRTSG
jgi:TetR/AcrR family transcriptional regulator